MSDFLCYFQATISFYQIMHMQTAPLPVNFQTLCESSKLYDPGQQYASHVRQLQRGDEPDTQYDFEPYVSHNAWYEQRRGPAADPQSPSLRRHCAPGRKPLGPAGNAGVGPAGNPLASSHG